MTETCPICGAETHKIIADQMRDTDKKVYYCEACDIAFKQGYATDAVDTASETQRGTARFGTSKLTLDEVFQTGLHNQSVNLDIIDKHVELRPDFNVLEVGCSSGYFLHCIANKVDRVYGVDLDTDSIDYANRHFTNGTFFNGYLGNSNFPKNQFDVIFCFQVLEHQPNPKAFMAELLQYLKPGGQVCLSVPNLHDALYSAYDIPYFETFAFIDEHLLYFSAKSIENLMNACGVEGNASHRQLFSLNNAFSWVFTDKPMTRFEDAADYKMRFKGSVEKHIQNEINSFLEKTDKEYKLTLEKLGLSTTLFYVGRFKGEY